MLENVHVNRILVNTLTLRRTFVGSPCNTVGYTVARLSEFHEPASGKASPIKWKANIAEVNGDMGISEKSEDSKPLIR